MPVSSFKGPIILTQSQFDSLQSGGLLETGREYLISDAEAEVGLTPTITIASTQILDTDPALAIQFTADQLALLSNDGYGTFIIDMTASSLGKYCWVKQNKTTTTLVIYRVEDLTVHKINITLATAQGVEESLTYTFSAVWGNIAGTLSNQIDLATALAGKQATLTAGDNITIENNIISAEVPEMEAKGGDAFIPVILNQDGNRYNGLQQIAELGTQNNTTIDLSIKDVTLSYMINPIQDGTGILRAYTYDYTYEDAYCVKYYMPSGESAGVELLSSFPSDIPSAYRHAYQILGAGWATTVLGLNSAYNFAIGESVIMVPGMGATYPRIVKIIRDNTGVDGTQSYTYYEMPSGTYSSSRFWSRFMKLGDHWYAYCDSNVVLIANEDFTEFTTAQATGFTGFVDSYRQSIHQLYTTDGKQIVLATGNIGGKLYVSTDGLTFTEKQVVVETSGNSSIVNYVEYLEDQDCFIFGAGRVLWMTKDFTNYYWVRYTAGDNSQEKYFFIDYNMSSYNYISVKKYLGRGLFTLWGASATSDKKAYLTTLYFNEGLMFATALTEIDATVTINNTKASSDAVICQDILYLPTSNGFVYAELKGMNIKSSDPVSIQADNETIINDNGELKTAIGGYTTIGPDTETVYHPIDANFVPVDNSTIIINNDAIKVGSISSSSVTGLATVATTGSYTDLTNTPSIPAAQIQSDWNQTNTTAKDYIKNKPNVIKQNSWGGSVKDFDIDEDYDYSDPPSGGPSTPLSLTVYNDDPSEPALINITEYTADSTSTSYSVYAPTADGSMLTSGSVATVALTGSYSDLSNTPTIPAAQVQSDYSQSDNTKVDYIKNKPDLSIYAQSANLATVATSGDYDDLLNKPTIPSVPVQDVTVGGVSVLSGTTAVIPALFSGSYSDLTDKPTIPAAQVNSDWNAASGVAQILNKPTIPNIVYSATQPQNPTTGMIWLEPVS